MRPAGAPSPAAPPGRSVVLVGLMGAGKSTIGRKLAERLGLPFFDADHEIEQAAGRSISEMFALWGEPAFRAGERRVIARLLGGPPVVLATGGGAFMDRDTRALIRARGLSVWLRCPLGVLVRRVSGRSHRPLIAGGNPRVVLEELMRMRDPIYAEADLVIDCDDDSTDDTTRNVMAALEAHRPWRRVAVPLGGRGYEILIGTGLLDRAGAALAPVLPQRRCVVVTDETVAGLHLPRLLAALSETGIAAQSVVIAPGEGSKSLEGFATLADSLLGAGIERRTTVIALGGGVVGDLAGFAAACALRGLPFVQIPTTLLAQVDSSVGGKTGINTRWGKNLLGAFHQPIAVLADTGVLATLPPRQLRAGYAEILKAGLIGDADLYRWCLAHGQALVGGDPSLLGEAVERACRFKAAVVGDDEREEKAQGGRALLNLGHTFGHALEAACGYDGRLLHGEAVALGLRLALLLSAELGHAPAGEAERLSAHLEVVGLPARLSALPATPDGAPLSADALIGHMRRDKKKRDGRLAFILLRAAGQAFTSAEVSEDAVRSLLKREGCAA